MWEQVDPGGEPPARDPALGRSLDGRQLCRELIVSAPRYRIVVLGRYPSLVAREDPQIVVEVRVERDDRLANCGTLTLRESEWEPLRRALEAAAEVELDVLRWPDRLYTPA
jgi:hypothetical protein